MEKKKKLSHTTNIDVLEMAEHPLSSTALKNEIEQFEIIDANISTPRRTNCKAAKL